MTIETIKTFITNRHGLKICVLVEIPKNPKGMAIIIHGFTSCKDRDHITLLANIALQNNLIAIRFDTTHSSGESDGKVEMATIATNNEDLEDVIKWAETQDWYHEPFTLVGHSLGGIAILDYTATHPQKVKAIAPLATVVSGELSMKAYIAFQPEEMKKWQETGFMDIPDRYNQGKFFHVPWSHMTSRYDHDALKYASKIKAPVFLFVGTQDQYCPPEDQKTLHDALGSVDKELHVIDGVPHICREPEHLQTLQTLFDAWLKRVA